MVDVRRLPVAVLCVLALAVAVTTVVGLVLTPSVEAMTIQRPDGTIAAVEQGWADAALVPTAPGVVLLTDELQQSPICDRGCYYPDTRTIYTRPGDPQRRRVFLHELGHDFVYQRFEPRHFEALNRIFGLGALGRFEQIDSDDRATPDEWAAEGWQWCARSTRISKYALPLWDGYLPTPAQHRRLCALFRRTSAQ